MTVCSFCLREFNTNNPRTKYCSSRCRGNKFNKLYRERYREKKIFFCHYCKKQLPNGKRRKKTSKFIYCSDECERFNKESQLERDKEITKTYRDKMQRLFISYKESLGCSICGYNRCGASLDFHHIFSSKKKQQITACLWFFSSDEYEQEITNCILVCKNCHYEIHYKKRNHQ